MNVEVTGQGFLEIPLDAVGIASYNNDAPTQRIDTQTQTYLLKIAERRFDRIKLTQDSDHYHDKPTYLGCIVSADRKKIFWVNNTRPLP